MATILLVHGAVFLASCFARYRLLVQGFFKGVVGWNWKASIHSAEAKIKTRQSSTLTESLGATWEDVLALLCNRISEDMKHKALLHACSHFRTWSKCLFQAYSSQCISCLPGIPWNCLICFYTLRCFGEFSPCSDNSEASGTDCASAAACASRRWHCVAPKYPKSGVTQRWL